MMPKQRTIPFQLEWQNKILNGIKTCTSRTKKYGNPGDWFEQFGSTFKISTVEKFPLEHVADFLYKEEGCDNPEEFIKIWVELHPRKGWVPNQIVFTHFFRRESNE